MNRALARAGLVTDGGPPSCPRCGQRLKFGTDSQGRTIESCRCGYRAFLQMRGAEDTRDRETATLARKVRDVLDGR